jgi:VWFA-related protein
MTQFNYPITRLSDYPIRAFIVAVVVVVMLAVHDGRESGGSQAAQQPPPQPTFRTEANYVRVDVFPTANGAPVTDLTQNEFEILDNGVPQKIEQFERVTVRSASLQETRIDPNNLRESRAILEQNPRARVFVLFLDPGHVEIEGSARIRKPLVDALDRFLGADDLIAVMTPEMSAGDVTFVRKTTTIDTLLTRYWYWGEKDRLNVSDPVEQNYRQCHPDIGACGAPRLADEMIDRRREKRTLDALEDLVRFLRGVREERKAVLAITDGWLLFAPNPGLTRSTPCQTQPAVPQVGVDPRTGRLGPLTDARPTGTPREECERDRIQLSQVDDEQQFRRILDEANRANTSFYPIDPRGLPVFDAPIARPGSFAPAPSPTVDRNMLLARVTSLRRLAEGTDGLAIVNSNDLAAGLNRVVADLTSYYLLGYYASGNLDGKFHSITVRVKRPGVQVRARRGYLAAAEAEVSAAARAVGASRESAPSPAGVAEMSAINRALAPLEGYTRQAAIRMHAVAGWKPGKTAAVWAVAELGQGDDWKQGADADLILVDAAGSTLASARSRVNAGQQTFRAVLAPDTPLVPGDYFVRARVKGAESVAVNETVRITLSDSPGASGAVFIRRGPSTGNRDVPTTDLRFRRNEQVRLEVPAPSEVGTARLLDRTGQPMGVPVTVDVREDQDGSRWQIMQLSLAPLAPSDYVVETSTANERMLTAFRVIQ